MRLTIRRINGLSIKQYSTTILLVGSIASSAHIRASGDIFHVNPKYDALKQSIVAEFALAYHDIPTAVHNYTVLAIHSNSPTVKQRALNVALEQNDLRAALDIATHWVVQEPEDVPAKFYLAHIALKSHEYELAAETLDSILNIDPNADLDKIVAGISPDSAEDRENLLETLKTSKEKNNPSVLVLIAGLEAQNGDLEQALLTVNRALKKRPKVTGFILMKANLLTGLGRQEEVEKWYAKASRKNKNNLDVHLAEVRFLIKTNQSELALNKLEKIIKTWPKAEEALFIAGLTSIDLKRYDQAEQYLVDLRNSSQYQNDAYYYLAVNAERKQHYETAKAYYRLVDGSLYIVSRRNLVSIYDKQNKLNDALRFLTQERVNYPQHASFLYQAQAEILKKMGNKQAALGLLSEAVKNNPDDPELLYSEVLLLDPFQDKDKLDKALKELLQLEPNSPTYLNAYAYTLALQNRRLTEARKYAEHALEYAPDQASILDTLGYITFLQNDFATASKVLEKAYFISQSAAIGVRYAKALFMLGDLESFNEVLQELKENHPNDPQLNQLDSLILPSQHMKKS
ncbi:tetratricopeptide repeat protein [Acinetobacter stercoris]|uniref:Tetratricopeptide repeat protein n=1 Tax=Acinetobacter stercoris TaxID=2126983 RepID=A0A2U3MYA3_9GAMM|nr:MULTISPECIES: tetratricopeptide repeat protein [Acinetobacter]SPL70365.1 tetratricopeptide repeat protein [Acinetobacter stercoris]